MTYQVGDVVLGVDPGSVSGWALLTIEAAPRVVRCGKIEFGKPRRREFRTASQCVAWACSGHAVELVAIEGQYLDRDPKKIASMIKLCRSAGRWVEAAEEAGLVHWEINPTKWQAAMLGKFKRDQMKKISRAVCAQRFGVKAPDHISDAVLIGAWAAAELYLDRRRARAPSSRSSRARSSPSAPRVTSSPPGGQGRGRLSFGTHSK